VSSIEDLRFQIQDLRLEIGGPKHSSAPWEPVGFRDRRYGAAGFLRSKIEAIRRIHSFHRLTAREWVGKFERFRGQSGSY
jgi:hypothetical protein